MAQTYDATIPVETNDWDNDLPAILNNFAALKSAFSGASAPSNTVGGQPWQHNTAAKGRRIRNIGNTAWLASLMGDAGQKMYVYRNDTCDGWTIDTTVGDRVLAIKDQAAGGGAYDVSGGVAAGSWTPLGHTHPGGTHTHTGPSHNHLWFVTGASYDRSYNAGGAAVQITSAVPIGTNGKILLADLTNGARKHPNIHMYTSLAGTGATGAATGDTGSGAAANTGRPAAAVGTMQKPDLT